MTMRNHHVLDLVDAYLQDALSISEAKALERHCERCRICQVALEEAQKRSEMFAALPAVEVPEALIARTELRLDHASNWSRLHPVAEWARTRTSLQAILTVAAVAACLIAAIHIHFWTMSATPYDLRVFGQTELLADSESSLRVFLVNRDTDAAMANVPVEVDLARSEPHQIVRLASFRTDDQGTGRLRFRLPDWKDGEYELRVRAQPRGENEFVRRRIKLHRSWQVMLSTDKPVYQPGQRIRIRILALARPDLKPVAGHNVSFSISDPKGNIIFRERDMTSPYGIASADCPLAEEIIQGTYKIQCDVGDTTSHATVEVKRYVLPKFKMVVELDKPYYAPGDTVCGTVQSDYFFGKPVARGHLEIDVRTMDADVQKLSRVESTTDDSGKAAFSFRLPEWLTGRPQDSGDANITLNATVTDPAGQIQSTSVARTVTTNPIRIEVIPEAGKLVRSVSNEVYLLTTYADGRPARTRIEITGYHRVFETSDLGVAVVEVRPWEDEIEWTVRATDDEGLSVRRDVTLRCGVNDDFLIRPDKAAYSGGETVRLTAVGGGAEPLFLDVIKDRQTVLTDVIRIENGRGKYAFDLPPDLFGTLKLCAYRFGSHTYPVFKSRVIYVRPASELTITARLDRETYRPGEKAQLTFQLADREGKPAPGAISLSAVDEAVFSVLGQAPESPSRFFTLDQELLEPVYAVYPWSPSVKQTTQERNQFEQALFARTALGGQGRPEVPEELLPFLDNDREILEVLERPDIDEYVDRMGPLAPEIRDFIRRKNSLYSLRANSFPAKVQALDATRQSGIETVTVLWVALGFVVVVALYIEIWAYSVTLGILTTFAGLFFMCVVMMPGVQQAREAARRSTVMNELNQLGIAVINLVDASGSMQPGQHPPAEDAGRTQPVRTREWFPETLLWRPELITDDQGLASLDVDLADSITTWRLNASAVTATGQLGASQSSIRVFQPFFVDLNLPVALTRGDEVDVPIVVYNYVDKPQSVSLTLAQAPWFELLGDQNQEITLDTREVRSVSYRLRVKTVGKHELEVTARGSGVADAVRRNIEVTPDGRRVEAVYSGTLSGPVEKSFEVPGDAIEGSAKALLKIYPSTFSEVVEGLDSIFRQPYGCFEQTSSTTYPNVLALDYLRRTNKSAPAVEAKARQYIHLGYQRLLTFEVAGGGFEWFGNPPANSTLTAYGLMEFEDMARVHDVDPAIIERTRDWLLAQRKSNGAWPANEHLLHEDPTRPGESLAELRSTAYIGWAVFGGSGNRDSAGPTLDYLLAHEPESIEDAYTLALVSNALLAMDGRGSAATRYVDRLEAMKRQTRNADRAWWGNASSRRTLFYGAGQSAEIETTALATMALLKSGRSPATAPAALLWLSEQKDGWGTWHCTQATVLALKALLAGIGQPLGGDRARHIQVIMNDKPLRSIDIPAGQGDVMQLIDLSSQFTEGLNQVRLVDTTGAETGYQLNFSYYVTDAARSNAEDRLRIAVNYDRTNLAVSELVTATATISNDMIKAAPMILVEIPIPAGFALEKDDLAKLVESDTIAKYELTSRNVIVYLRALDAGRSVNVKYRLRATMPVKLSVPRAIAYEYYDPENRASSEVTSMVVMTGN